jgi:separase
MGCSSGNQYTKGEFEPYGIVLDYILTGCASFVGNLWNVSSGIYFFAEDVLNSLNEASKSLNEASNICMHLIKARNTCRLSHLTGSAPVIYGMPLSFE